MRAIVGIVFVVLGCALAQEAPTAVQVLKNIYSTCLQDASFSCVKPKLRSFLSKSLQKDKIYLTEDLAVVGNGRSLNEVDDEVPTEEGVHDDREKMLRSLMLDRMDQFLSTHDLRIRIPKEIVSSISLPEFLAKEIPAEVKIPLCDTPVEQGRGFVKKVLIPFLLGLKFKATALIPLAFALIALKTWKAFTLGLLSLVLSGAMVIFKFTKPKVVNYEVYHYPSHPSPPAVEHAYGEHHGYGRAATDAQDLAYRSS